MPKMFSGWCPVCQQSKMLTTMDRPQGSACRCLSCGTGLSVTGKNQILTLPFFAFVCYLIFYLPTQGRTPSPVEILLGLASLLIFTLYNRKFIRYRPTDQPE